MCEASGAGRRYADIKSGLCRCISVSCVSNCMECGPASVQGAIAVSMLSWSCHMAVCMQDGRRMLLVRHIVLLLPGQ